MIDAKIAAEHLNKDWPVEDGFKGYYKYQGLPFSAVVQPPYLVEAALSYDRFRPDDVMIHTYPKTGTHFMGDIVKSIMLEAEGLACDQHVNGKKFSMNALELNPFSKPDSPMEKIDESPSPRIIATHLPWSHLPSGALDSKIKHIQVIRNPKDSLCSAFPFLKTKVMVESYLWEQYISTTVSKGKTILMDYFDWMKTWYAHRYDDNLLTLYYEDMKQDLRLAVVKVCNFLCISLNDEQISRVVETNTFENRVKNADFYSSMFLNKGQSGGWKTQFTVAQNEALDNWIAEGMVGLDEFEIKYK